MGNVAAAAVVPFVHEDDCATSDAQPEWYEVRHGTWERVCSCRTDHRYDPAPAAKVLADPSRHRHQPPDCTGTAFVKTDEVTGEKFTRCRECESSTHFVDTRYMDKASLRGLVR